MAGQRTESGEPSTHPSATPQSQTVDSGIDAFVSYASPDSVAANAIVETIERGGLRCWIAPRDVVPGSLYADGIVRAINAARIFILVLSEHAVSSPHVGKEIERASSKRRPIIAVRTDRAALTPALEYFLSESQWIDAGDTGVYAAADKVVAAVRIHAEVTPAEGPVGTSDRIQSVSLRRWLPAAVGAGLVGVVLLGYVAADRFRHPKPDSSHSAAAAVVPAIGTTTPAKSIAVLPFADMSDKHD
jgi:TIR domain